MEKRKIKILTICVSVLYIYAVIIIMKIMFVDDLSNIVNAQSSKSLTVFQSRGTIYDCNLEPLTNSQTVNLGVARPVQEIIPSLKNTGNLGNEELLSTEKPYVFTTENAFASPFVKYFEISKKYIPTANHIIGYTNYDNVGVSGAEKIFEEVLSNNKGEIKVSYSIDGIGRMLIGDKVDYVDTMEKSKAGIVLTLDKEIQKIAEEEAKKIEKGAVVIVSIPDCEIKASVSMPNFDPYNVEKSFDDKNSPLINRAFTGFEVGSVFKLVDTITALNLDYDYKKKYKCTGQIEVDDMVFTCYDGDKHGEVDMEQALAKSCNCYFINLMQNIGEKEIYQTTQKLGLCESTEFYENFNTEKGNLTSLYSLSNNKALANMSIGQGDLLITPVKIAELINCIASGGEYTTAKLYKGELNENRELIPYNKSSDSLRITKTSVAFQIRQYMENVVKNGTGKSVYLEGKHIGLKTGTAQTGIFENGDELSNFWYAGFIGNTTIPEYAVVVMSEKTLEYENKVPEVFKNISEKILKKSH